MLFIDIERPGGDVWQDPGGVERAMRPLGLPLPLQQIVPYAATIPLRDLRVRMVVKTWMAEDRGLWEPLYRKRIHQIVGTLKRFVALETITIEFCQDWEKDSGRHTFFDDVRIRMEPATRKLLTGNLSTADHSRQSTTDIWDAHFFSPPVLRLNIKSPINVTHGISVNGMAMPVRAEEHFGARHPQNDIRHWYKMSEASPCTQREKKQLSTETKVVLPTMSTHTTLAFLNLPGELRDMIYRYCLHVPMNHNHQECAQFREEGDPARCFSLDTTILRVCRQTYHEAADLLRKERLLLWIRIPWPETVSNRGPQWIDTMPTELPTALQQILPFAAFIPLQDLHIRIRAAYRSTESWDVPEMMCRRSIHRVVGTLRCFPALQTVTVVFSRECVALCSTKARIAPVVSMDMMRAHRPQVLECFGRLRGFKKVTIRGIDPVQARALEDLMQGPRLLEEEADSVEQEAMFTCGCKRPNQRART
ncbi:MAG: hypothetical protein Q9207_001046 [Kuettlingeria erythrocarpa]